jgi:hypothetical protein
MESEWPRVALLDEGELDDVRSMLRELGVAHCHAREATVGDLVPVLFSTPERARALAEGAAEAPPFHLQVVVGPPGGDDLDGPGRLQLRRPLDASVLRLLTRRESHLFGRDRRLSTRVAMGIPVKISVGDDTREVIIASISVGGCGLVSPARMREGSIVEISLPREISGRRELLLVGSVMGAREVTTADGHNWDISVAFEELDMIDRVTLRALMARHAIDFRPRRGRSGRVERSLRDRAVPAGVERRTQIRRRFHQRVMGVCQGVAHVLMAHDLSPTGLGVQPTDRLVPGDALTLAVFGAIDAAPLIARAVVDRGDGLDRTFLRFVDLPPETARRVAALLETLAPVDLDCVAD